VKNVSKKNNPKSYVTRAECKQMMGVVKDDISVMKKALVGEDLQGGIVKKLSDIETTLKMWSAIKNILVPILIAVASSLITAALLGGLHLP